MTTYADIIARKSAIRPPSGYDPSGLSAHLFPHQRDITRWAVRKGKSAVFADTGLGKAIILLEWARIIAQDHGRVLILAPLAVGQQLGHEAARFGVPAEYVRADNGAQIVISNYEMLPHFDASQFAGIVLDESSILKSLDGKTRTRLITLFADTPFKLACTATPAPNDFTELGNHAEFLGVCSRAEMLAEYFVHDGSSTQDWRVKGHAIEAFWRWVATWAAVIRKPSDLNYDDGAYTLPELTMHDYIVPASAELRARFPKGASTLTEHRGVRRGSLESRATTTAQLVEMYADRGEQSVVWCELNDEQDLIADLLRSSAVSIAGATKDDIKLERHAAWKEGRVACLISKPSIFGFGLNWQHCNKVIFAGASHSFEKTYQAIRRCWRFGQTRPVSVDMVQSDLETAVAANYRRKELDHARMGEAMQRLVGDAIRAEVQGLTREFNAYAPTLELEFPTWL